MTKADLLMLMLVVFPWSLAVATLVALWRLR